MTRKVSLCTLFLLFCFLSAGICPAANDSRGLQVQLKNSSGNEEQVSLYKGSFALLIGMSKYNAGWPVLPSVPSEINAVERLLQEKGFHVEKVIDPDGDALETSFRTFINKYGLQRENRLLFFFSGHGHTRKDGKKGYLVPVDAPDPKKNITGFLQKALGMNQVLSWARDIEAKHALFLFDSCFSGTIFNQKSGSPPPTHITRLTIEPVRQFITAGSAGEKVPAASTFTPTFIDALRQGHADLNRDGYVSATELGIYLQTELPSKTDQTPQFGKIRDYDLARGDFIFSAGSRIQTASLPLSKKEMAAASANTGIMRVESSPQGAAVYVDNTFQGSTPILLNNVSPGTYNIRTEKKGFLSETKFVQIGQAKQVSLSFQLIALAAEGTLTVNTTPVGAKVSILEFQKAYAPGIELPAGNYTIEVSKHGFFPDTAKVQIHENEDLLLNITLKRQTSIAAPDNQEIEPQNYFENRPQLIADTAPTSPAEPITINAEKEKKVLQEKPALPPDIANYIINLRSNNSGTKRNTAKIVYRRDIDHPAVMQTVVDELLKGVAQGSDDKYHVDAMAWFCNILGKTGKSKYLKTLDKVANSSTNRKIRKYAKKNLRKLQ